MVTVSALLPSSYADASMINNNEFYLIAKAETFTRFQDSFSLQARTHLFANDA